MADAWMSVGRVSPMESVAATSASSRPRSAKDSGAATASSWPDAEARAKRHAAEANVEASAGRRAAAR